MESGIKRYFQFGAKLATQAHLFRNTLFLGGRCACQDPELRWRLPAFEWLNPWDWNSFSDFLAENVSVKSLSQCCKRIFLKIFSPKFMKSSSMGIIGRWGVKNWENCRCQALPPIRQLKLKIDVFMNQQVDSRPDDWIQNSATHDSLLGSLSSTEFFKNS